MSREEEITKIEFIYPKARFTEKKDNEIDTNIEKVGDVEYLLSLYEELSETNKKKAIEYLESLIDQDIKNDLLQACKEVQEWEEGKIELRSLDDLIAEI